MASNAKNLAELLNQDSTVAVGDIADGSVTTAKLAADAVTAAKLANDAVVTANIVDGNVTTAKIVDDAITTAKINASMITHIDAGSTKAQGVTTSFADTNLSGNITIPAGCTRIIWHMRGGFRQNGIGTAHACYRLKFVRSGDNRTTYIGQGSWGMGIEQNVGTSIGSNHSVSTYYANLFDYDSDDNQAQIAVGDTYAVTIQVKSANGANGSNLYTFGDVTTNVSYYPAFMTFMFF